MIDFYGAVNTAGESAPVEVDAAAVFGQLADGLEFTEYLIFTIDGNAYSFEAALTALNSDPSGELFVERTVTLGAGEYTGELSSVAFSGDGTEPVGAVALSAAVDGGITVTLRLSVSVGGDVRLVAGENAFAAMLLGVTPMTGVFTLCRGEDIREEEKLRRGGGLITDSYAADVSADADGIYFTAYFDAGVIPEIVLMLNGQPVMRAPALETAFSTTACQAAAVNGIAVLPEGYALGVFSVSSGGASVSAYKLLSEACAVDGPYALEVRLPDGKLFSDADGKYLGIFNERELTVFDGELRPCFTAAGGKLADIASDGTVAVIDDGLTVYGAETMHFGIDVPDSFRFDRDTDGTYHFAMLYGGTLRRYGIKDGKLTQTEEAEIGVHSVLMHASDGKIALCSPSRSEVRGGSRADAAQSAYLAELFSGVDAQSELTGGNGMFKAATAGGVKIYDIMLGLVCTVDYSSDSQAEAELYGSTVVLRRNGTLTANVRSYSSRGLAELTELPDDAVCAQTVGGQLVVVRPEGAAEVYGVVRKTAALYSGDFGETASFYMRGASDPSGGKQRIKIMLSITDSVGG